MVRKLEELNLIDNFLFEALASHSEIGTAFGRKLVEIILRKSPEKVQVVAQRTYAGSSPQLHGARLDVYLEEQPGREKVVPWSYDIEPEKDDKLQAVNSLPKRVRFYHAKIDAKGLKSGDSYHKLKNVAVIMIMPFDPFGSDRMVYTIRNICTEEPDMPYDDGAFTMFLYTKGQKGIPSVELQQFLNYFEHTTEDNVCNKDLVELHEMVARVKVDEEVELEYMKIFEREEMIREEGGTLCLLRQIVKKIAKGKPPGIIADELEESIETIESLCGFIQDNSDKTLEELARMI